MRLHFFHADLLTSCLSRPLAATSYIPVLHTLALRKSLPDALPSLQHNRQKFRCKDCYMCVHYRVRSRCPDCIAEEMKNVVLQMPRGQGWNIKRPSLDSDAGALVNAVRDGEAGSTSRDASRKDFRADARSKKTEGLLLEAAASKSTLPGAVIGSMGMAGDPKSPEVGNGSEFELRQQIDTLRAQHAHAARYDPFSSLVRWMRQGWLKPLECLLPLPRLARASPSILCKRFCPPLSQDGQSDSQT